MLKELHEGLFERTSLKYGRNPSEADVTDVRSLLLSSKMGKRAKFQVE